MIIAGIHVFPFNSRKSKGNCVVCGKRMKTGIGYHHVYHKRIRMKTLDRWFHKNLPDRQTKMALLCSEDCITLYSLRREVI